MKKELQNIFGTPALKQHFEQYQYIFHTDYYQSMVTQQISDEYEVHIEEYNHTYAIGKNCKKSVSCQIARVYDRADHEYIYEYRNYFGRLCVASFMWKPDRPFVFFSCDLNGYAFYDIKACQEYGYYPQGYVNDTLAGIPYWYVKNIIFNSENHWLAVNGQDTMNCSYACLLDLSDLACMPYPLVSLSDVVSEKASSLGLSGLNDFATVALGWNDDGSIDVLAGEDNSIEVILPEIFYRQPQALFQYEKHDLSQEGEKHGE